MTVDIALTGTGGIGSVHLNNLATIDATNIIGVCDVAENTAMETAERFDATAYTDHERMLADEDADALFVTIPPFTHTNQETLAAAHGIDLFVEKPIALSRETAAEVNTAIERAGVLSQVGHMFRYSTVTERAKQLVNDRDLTLLDGRWFGGVPPSGWWGIKEKSGGQVVEQAAHVFDLLRYFGGEVTSITAEGSKNVVKDSIDFEDATSATMKHKNGVVSHVATSAASPEELINLHIVGDGLKLRLEFWFEGEDPPRSVGSLTGTVDGESIDVHTEDDAWTREIEAFVEAVETDDPSLLRSSYDDAYRTFELTLTVNNVLENGRSGMVQY